MAMERLKLFLSAQMLCTFIAIISMFKMLLLSRNASFRYAGRAKEVYFVDPPARFINISEIVILEQGSLLAPSSLLLSGTVLFLLSNITDFCSQVFSLFVCYFVAWCLLPPFQFLSFHVLIDQC